MRERKGDIGGREEEREERRGGREREIQVHKSVCVPMCARMYAERSTSVVLPWKLYSLFFYCYDKIP